MRDNKLLGDDVDLGKLAKEMKNYTGAEIEAVVKSANSFALNRHHNLLDFTKTFKIENPGKVEMQDFIRALEEVKPEFGVDDVKMEVYQKAPMIDWGARGRKIFSDTAKIVEEVKKNQVQLASVVLYGESGTGKTTLAVKIASKSGCPFVKFVTSEDLIGMSEIYKVNYINKCFEDAYKSKQSVVILDDLERLVEYIEIG